jgi:ComF family protein
MESARFVDGFGPAEGVLCAPCRMARPLFQRAVAYGVYESELKRLLHLLKYERMRPLGDVLGERLAEAVLSLQGSAAKELLVVPVPLFAAKERGRGYNQSDVLARGALRVVRAMAPEWRMQYEPALLERRRATQTQAGLNPRGRRRNLQGAFAVRESGFRVGAEVLLIDDIYTTGATARECARVLRRAGAGKVWVATLARAQKPQVALWDSGQERAPMGFG